MIGDLTIYICIGTIIAILCIAYGEKKMKFLAFLLIAVGFLFSYFQIKNMLDSVASKNLTTEYGLHLKKHLICNYLFSAFLVLCFLFLLKSMF